MAVRTVNASSLIRTASFSTNSIVRPHYVTSPCHSRTFHGGASIRFQVLQRRRCHIELHRVRNYSVHSLIDLVMQEFVASRRKNRVRASAKYASNFEYCFTVQSRVMHSSISTCPNEAHKLLCV